MKDYFDEEEYLEDIFGDEIKLGDGFYRFHDDCSFRELLIHEKNFIQFAEDELDVKKEER